VPLIKLLLFLRSRNLQCQRVYKAEAPINSICLHPNQGELIMGDQSGLLHIWDLKTDHNEQFVCYDNFLSFVTMVCIQFLCFGSLDTRS